MATSDHNVTAPLYQEYIRWLSEDERSHAWAVLSGIVDGLPARVKYDLANSLLVTSRDAATSTYTEHTAWGHIVLQAAGAAQDDTTDSAAAEKLVSNVLVFAREHYIGRLS